MMKNKLIDLNDHLFEMIERLNDDKLKGEALTREISRASAMTGVASQIIAVGSLALNAWKAMDNSMSNEKLPTMLGWSEAPSPSSLRIAK
jgi:hypothetical protein